jgi:hypothetical protein
LKTTRIEIVRYSRRIVTDNTPLSTEDERLTIDLSPKAFDLDGLRLESRQVIKQPKPAIISRLRNFLRRK